MDGFRQRRLGDGRDGVHWLGKGVDGPSWEGTVMGALLTLAWLDGFGGGVSGESVRLYRPESLVLPAIPEPAFYAAAVGFIMVGYSWRRRRYLKRSP